MLLVIKGLIERQRVDRVNAYMIFCSNLVNQQPMSIYQFNPLPFDDELQESEVTEDDRELYEQGRLIRLPNVNYAD